MLTRKLALGSSAAGGIRFVGGATALNSGQTPTFNLTSLSGGLSTAPVTGDIVIACIAFNFPQDRNIQCTTSGYTEIADLYADSSNDSQLGVYFKVLTSDETSVAFDIGTTFAASSFAVHVWRGVDSTTPLDATTTTATGTSSGRPDAPAITTVTSNAVVIAVGANAGSTFSQALSSLTVPSGMENFYQSTVSSNRGIGIASTYRPTAGAYDPPAFGGGSSSSSNSFCAATLALRPA
jgi:hypothetical protein